MDITVDEWVAELERLGVGNDVKGFTSEELADAMGCTMQTARKYLKRAFKAQRAEYCGERLTYRINGRPLPVPVYRLL